MKKLYLLTTTAPTGLDCYIGFVVCATSPLEAEKFIPPDAGAEWASCNVVCTLIGIASKRLKKGVVLDSFTAA